MLSCFINSLIITRFGISKNRFEGKGEMNLRMQVIIKRKMLFSGYTCVRGCEFL